MTTDTTACSLRIISINDVYLLDNFARLSTLIKELRTENTITLLAGDFLGPSLLGSLDKGRGMVATMNLTPISHVCFGNHEADYGVDELISRIKVSQNCYAVSCLATFLPHVPHLLLSSTALCGYLDCLSRSLTGSG